MLQEDMWNKVGYNLYGLITDVIKGKIALLKKWSPLNMSDYDDTLHTRKAVLKKKWFSINRWDKGNIYLLALYSWIINYDYNEPITKEIINKVEALTDSDRNKALKKYADEYYWIGKSEKQTWIVNNIGEFITNAQGATNIIITAWIEELQKLKIQNTINIEIPIIVVKTWKEKIEAIINYIIDILGYIPKKIVINEDRPEYFLECWQDLADILRTNIQVNTIEIDDSNNAIIKNKTLYWP